MSAYDSFPFLLFTTMATSIVFPLLSEENIEKRLARSTRFILFRSTALGEKSLDTTTAPRKCLPGEKYSTPKGKRLRVLLRKKSLSSRGLNRMYVGSIELYYTVRRERFFSRRRFRTRRPSRVAMRFRNPCVVLRFFFFGCQVRFVFAISGNYISAIHYLQMWKTFVRIVDITTSSCLESRPPPITRQVLC